jgi:hypothetical protein
MKRPTNPEREAELRELHPEWSEEMINIYASSRGPILSETKPDWTHESGGAWVFGFDEEGRKVWV